MSNFRFTIARTNAEKELGYRLRYQVFVEEFRFESPLDHPHGLEIDQFDRYSIHILAWDKNNQLVGTSRIVLPSSSLGLPLQGFPSELRLPSDGRIDLRRTVEFSRLAVHKDYRRPSTSGQLSAELPISLIIAGMRVAKAVDADWIAFISEPKIIKLCCLFGFGASLIEVADEVLFHKALRAPYLASLKDAWEKTAQLCPPCHRQLVPTEASASLHPEEHTPMPKNTSLDAFCGRKRGTKASL